MSQENIIKNTMTSVYEENKNSKISVFLFLYIILGFTFIAYQLGVLPSLNTEFKVSSVHHELGYAYIAELQNSHVFHFVEKKFKLLQDGLILGPSHSQHLDIRQRGDGAYDITNNIVRFSVIKNSTLSNHIFTIKRPYLINPYLLGLIIISLFAAIFLFYKTFKIEKSKYISKIYPYTNLIFNKSFQIISNNPRILLTYTIIGWFFILYQFGHIPFLYTQFKVTDINHELGHAYITKLSGPASFHVVEAKFQLSQDGKILGPSNSQHADIREKGNGAYDITKNYLRFSTVNNTPITTHVFSIKRPYVSNPYIVGLIIISLLGTMGWLCLRFPTISGFIPWISFSFASFSIINQLLSPIQPVVSLDSDLYLGVAQSILDKHLPFFGASPPGYPLFLVLIKLITQATSLVNQYVIISQTALSLFSALLLTYAVYKWSHFLSVITVFIIYFFWFNNPSLQEFNGYILTDSLFASLLMIYVALLLLCFHPHNKLIHWFLLSLITAVAIYVRSPGLFLLPCTLVILMYILYNNHFQTWKKVLCYCIPFITLLSSLLFYNFTYGHFKGFSLYGGINLIGATCYGLPLY